VTHCLYGPVGLLRASLRVGVVSSGAEPLERQRTGRIAQGVRTVRPSFVVTVFVWINGGPFRRTGRPGWAIPTTIRQQELLSSTDVAFSGISVNEHRGENFSLMCKCPWCPSQPTGQTRYSQDIAVVQVFRSRRRRKWWQKRPRQVSWSERSKESP